MIENKGVNMENITYRKPLRVKLVKRQHLHIRINGVVVTWVVAIDPPGVRFPLNAFCTFTIVPALAA